jgi:hypothetical protein
MIVERNSTDASGLLPEIIESLDADFHLPLYHRDLKLRQPLGIYNASLASVLGSFEDVLDEFEQLMIDRPYRRQNELPKWSDDNLMNSQRQLLYSLMEHMEDCFNVLKCFVQPPSSDPRKRTKAAYCKSSTIIDTCVKSVEPYWNHISDIVNHSKHNQGRVRFCVIFDENNMIPGYFVESAEEILDRANDQVSDWEVLGPSSAIHGKYRDTAFSFARNLRYHFVNVYFVSKELADAVNSLTAGQRTPHTGTKSDDSKILGIAARIEKLPLYFYRDEMRLDTPAVKVIKRSETDIQLRLSCPDNNTILLSPPHGKKMFAWVAYRSDGVSNKIILPYLG